MNAYGVKWIGRDKRERKKKKKNKRKRRGRITQ